MTSLKELLKTHGNPPKEVYLDNENSGWIPPEVVSAMLPYFNEKGYGHPSITNKPGWEAYELVESTAEAVAKTLGIDPSRVNFVHSGTEANNLAILGTARLMRNKWGRRKIVISDIEHYSVLLPALSLEEAGFTVIRAPVDEEGFVDPDVLAELVNRDTAMVSIQAVNHEIGTIQDLRGLVEIVKDRNPDVLFHTDACDAYARVPIDMGIGLDMITLSSHKILGPKGVGVLALADGVLIDPLLKGALSSQSLWPGVENVPALAGFKKALELAFEDKGSMQRVQRLRDMLMDGILKSIPDTLLNGPKGEMRVQDNLNISFLHIEGEALTVELSIRGVYVSSGSACTSRVLEPSHVMLAIGREYEAAHGSILFKLTRYHSEEDIDYVLEHVPEAVKRLRTISPLGKG